MAARARSFKQSEVTRAIRGVEAAGKVVHRVDIAADGAISVVTAVAERTEAVPYSPVDALKALREARKRGAA